MHRAFSSTSSTPKLVALPTLMLRSAQWRYLQARPMLDDKTRVPQGLYSLGVFIKQLVSLSQRLLRHLVLHTKQVPGKTRGFEVSISILFLCKR